MVHICFVGVIKMGRTPLYCLNLSCTRTPSKQHTDKHIHSHTGFNNGWLTCRAVCRYKPLSRRLNIKFSQVSLTCQVSFVTRSTWCCHTRPAIPFLHSQVGFVTCKVNTCLLFFFVFSLLLFCRGSGGGDCGCGDVVGCRCL